LQADTSDGDLVNKLRQRELELNVELLSCKRAGKQYWETPRNLAVYVGSAAQAQAVIRAAYRLRKSSLAAVRNHPNLIKAELKVQFEMRQRRRQASGVQRNNNPLQRQAYAVIFSSQQ
jgi:hypothetical protein